MMYGNDIEYCIVYINQLYKLNYCLVWYVLFIDFEVNLYFFIKLKQDFVYCIQDEYWNKNKMLMIEIGFQN